MKRFLIITALFLFGFYPDYGQGFLPYSQKIPDSDVAIEFVPIPGGTFLMGSSEAGAATDESPQRKVKVDPFWMGKYEITWEQYDRFVNEEIENVKLLGVDAITAPTRPYIDMSFGMGRDGYPAINMTHYAALMYARWLSAKTGHFYRLPTEAEWEYACRAGSNTSYSFGNNPNELEQYAWFHDNSENAYHQVGTKKPNAFGLFDMHGNVAEWAMDQYVPDYNKRLVGAVALNPWIKPTVLDPRSVRGGSWTDTRDDLRSAKRRGSSKAWKKRDPQLPKSLWWLTDAPFLGFRLVRVKETPSKETMEKYWINAMDDF